MSSPDRKPTEPTLVSPSQHLISARARVVAEAMAAANGPNDQETLVPCPACECCAWCMGAHVVTPTHAVAIRETAAHLAVSDAPNEIAELDDPGEVKR